MNQYETNRLAVAIFGGDKVRATQYYDTANVFGSFPDYILVGIGDGNFDYFKHPARDWVFSVPKTSGCRATSFGTMSYLRHIAPQARIVLA